jgi:uncharacterized repeat protein (TIGR03803 family)
VILAGNSLYGTTEAGGIKGAGTIYSVPLGGGGAPTNSFSFNQSNGFAPASSLALAGITFYGTTTFGGPSGGRGTVFSFGVMPTALQQLSTTAPTTFGSQVRNTETQRTFRPLHGSQHHLPCHTHRLPRGVGIQPLH